MENNQTTPFRRDQDTPTLTELFFVDRWNVYLEAGLLGRRYLRQKYYGQKEFKMLFWYLLGKRTRLFVNGIMDQVRIKLNNAIQYEAFDNEFSQKYVS